MKLTEKIFGTHSQRELKRIYPIVDKIEALRPTMQNMTDEELRDQTRKFRERLGNGETLDDLLPIAGFSAGAGAAFGSSFGAGAGSAFGSSFGEGAGSS